MKQWLLIIPILLFTNHLFSQSFGELPIHISYFGENGIHPGVKLGLEYPLSQKEKVKKRWTAKRQDRKGPKTFRKEWALIGNVGFYNHPNNHSGLLISPEIAWRRTKMHKKGNFFGASLGLGYLQRFYNIPTYELGSNEPIGGAGKGQFLSTFSIAFGRDLMVKRDMPLKWYVKPSVMVVMPYNHTVVATPVLEIGVSYPLFN